MCVYVIEGVVASLKDTALSVMQSLESVCAAHVDQATKLKLCEPPTFSTVLRCTGSKKFPMHNSACHK